MSRRKNFKNIRHRVIKLNFFDPCSNRFITRKLFSCSVRDAMALGVAIALCYRYVFFGYVILND